VGRFVAGFATASLVWGIGAALYLGGVLEWSGEAPEAQVAPDAPDAGERDETEPAGRRRRRRGRRQARSTGGNAPRGEATTGDDLGEDDPRSLDLGAAGGEAQLSRAQIQAGMDEGFGRIRRCLILAAGDEPVTGRLTFGLRIDSDGSVSRVNLSGPAAVTTGECGQCLRSAARSVRFASFDGPPMVARYPITLD